MKVKLFLITFMINLSTLLGQMEVKEQRELTLILNMENVSAIPRNFRSASDKLVSNINYPSIIGLHELQISGSSQFSSEGLRSILERLDSATPLIIVDLRLESHGFVNDAAITWYEGNNWDNISKSKKEIVSSEQLQLEQFLKLEHILAEKKIKFPADPFIRVPIPLKVEKISTEQELVESFNLGYLRFCVTDHAKPTDKIVDKFIKFVQALPENTWLHFHCAAGIGRTTTFMIMYDMMHNAKQVSFDEIILRQHYLGGSDLSKLPEETVWKYPPAVERKIYIKKFYEYCFENEDNFKTSWTEYLKKSI